MRFLPPRRWFQFRLSTWFVLVAILGWLLATRPAIDMGDKLLDRDSTVRGFSFSLLLDPRRRDDMQMLGEQWRSVPDAFEITLTTYLPEDTRKVSLTIGPKESVYPALALVAFLSWKTAWAIRGRLKKPVDSMPMARTSISEINS